MCSSLTVARVLKVLPQPHLTTQSWYFGWMSAFMVLDLGGEEGSRRCGRRQASGPAEAFEQAQGQADRQADDVVEPALLEARHEPVGGLLDRVPARLPLPLPQGDVGLDLPGRDRAHRHPGPLPAALDPRVGDAQDAD